MFIQAIKDATPQANGQSDLRHLFAYRPDATRHLLAFTQQVMRDMGPLAAGETELLAALTSKRNHCLF
jgi:alkylhydroperoxidase family enzyme